MRLKPVINRVLCASLLLSVLGCSADENIQQWQLPPEIDEVSGLAIGPDDSVYLHDDEIAAVYELSLASGDVSTVFHIERPIIEGDFEGIAHTASHIYLITSQGELFRIPRAPDMSEAIVSADVFDTGLSEICEVEGLHILDSDLYIACKTPYLKSDKGRLLLIEYSLASYSITRELRLDLEALSLKKFNPSAIWLDAERIVLLSARQRKIIELSWSGELLREFKLDKSRHPQPEGLVVANGRYIIADEGGGDGGRVAIYNGFPGD